MEAEILKKRVVKILSDHFGRSQEEITPKTYLPRGVIQMLMIRLSSDPEINTLQISDLSDRCTVDEFLTKLKIN